MDGKTTRIWIYPPSSVSLVRSQGQHETTGFRGGFHTACLSRRATMELSCYDCSAAALVLKCTLPMHRSVLQTVLSSGPHEEGLQSTKQSIPTPSSKYVLATTFLYQLFEVRVQTNGFVTGLCYSVIVCCICSPSLLTLPPSAPCPNCLLPSLLPVSPSASTHSHSFIHPPLL